MAVQTKHPMVTSSVKHLVIVDLQAATAYLHANDSAMPGNANRIITNGTSAGGAVSFVKALQATAPTSNHIYKH